MPYLSEAIVGMLAFVLAPYALLAFLVRPIVSGVRENRRTAALGFFSLYALVAIFFRFWLWTIAPGSETSDWIDWTLLTFLVALFCAVDVKAIGLVGRLRIGRPQQ